MNPLAPFQCELPWNLLATCLNEILLAVQTEKMRIMGFGGMVVLDHEWCWYQRLQVKTSWEICQVLEGLALAPA